jgi:signal-transduction protein with cAMP-binding, CBS, and nucleotidyltransferase domain
VILIGSLFLQVEGGSYNTATHRGGFMSILDLCYKNVVICEKTASLRHAAQLMKKHNVGNLLVVEILGSKKAVGILTDRDIVMGVAADNHSLISEVGEIMSNELVKVSATMGISEVVDLMAKECIRRVIVVDKSENVVGIVTTDEILQLIAREMKGLGNLFQKQNYKSNSVKLLQESFLT